MNSSERKLIPYGRKVPVYLDLDELSVILSVFRSRYQDDMTRSILKSVYRVYDKYDYDQLPF